VAACCDICVLILVYLWPYTGIYVCACCYVCPDTAVHACARVYAHGYGRRRVELVVWHEVVERLSYCCGMLYLLYLSVALNSWLPRCLRVCM
jgi:hypothetical protein